MNKYHLRAYITFSNAHTASRLAFKKYLCNFGRETSKAQAMQSDVGGIPSFQKYFVKKIEKNGCSGGAEHTKTEQITNDVFF